VIILKVLTLMEEMTRIALIKLMQNRITVLLDIHFKIFARLLRDQLLVCPYFPNFQIFKFSNSHIGFAKLRLTTVNLSFKLLTLLS